jgi:hypothetical protein
MPAYTVKAGDSLSEIAKAHGVTYWRAIYNDPANAGFRVKRPNPNLIQPGDSIVIPGGATGGGAATAATAAVASRKPTPLMGLLHQQPSGLLS